MDANQKTSCPRGVTLLTAPALSSTRTTDRAFLFSASVVAPPKSLAYRIAARTVSRGISRSTS